MSNYLIIRFDIVDQDRFSEYGRRVMPLLGRHRGKVIVSNNAARVLEGPEPGMNVVIQFSSEDEAMAFYQDPEYQPVKAIRLAATENCAAVLSPAFTY